MQTTDAEEAIRAVLRHEYPDRGVSDISVYDGWIAHHTASVEFADGQVVYAKVSADGTRERISRQIAVSKFVRNNTPIETPDVLRGDLSPPDGVNPYFVMEPMAGENLEPSWREAGPDQRREFVHRVVRALVEIHVSFDSAGRITGGSETALELERGSWSEVLQRRLDLRAPDVPERFSNVIPRLKAMVHSRRELLDQAPTVLVHEDPVPKNYFVDPDGIVDWETSIVGDPVLDLARCEWGYVDRPYIDEQEMLRAAIYDTYESESDLALSDVDERRRIYEAVTYLGTIRSFEQWAPSAEEPVEGLAEMVREQFSSKVAAAKAAN